MSDITESREIHDVDVHVGRRIRQRRTVLGQSQTDLAQALGLSFQQIQKYERGTNRISSSKLYLVAKSQKVPMEYYFAGLDPTDEEPPEVDVETARALEWLNTDKALRMAKLLDGQSDARLGRLLGIMQNILTLPE